MKADYIYRDAGDSRRARVFKHSSGEGWDYDLFVRHVIGGGWHVRAGELSSNGESPARTRKELLAWLDDMGIRIAVLSVETVTQGWPEKEPPKPTEDAAIKIRRGQIWRQGSRKLVVEWVAPHWNKRLCADELEVGCRFVTPSGRERGVMIKNRKPASQRYHEQHFREKYRFVCEPEDAAEHGLRINFPEGA